MQCFRYLILCERGCICSSAATTFSLLQRGQSDTLTYFNNFLGFNEFDQICHELSLVTGHHHSTPGVISSELKGEKK